MAIERYLGAHSSYGAKRLKANKINNYKSVFLSINDYEEVTDEFKGIKIWWTSSKQIPQQKALFTYDDDGEKRYYKLICHRIYRDIITNVYLQHLIDERPLQPKQGNTSFIPITREPVEATSYSSTLLPLILLPRTQKRRRVFWMIL